MLTELGLLAGATSFVAEFAGIGAVRDLVIRAWDVEHLRERYEAFCAQFEPMNPTTPTQILAAQIRLVHEWRRFPFFDPGLPPELLGPDPTHAWVGVRAGDLFGRRHQSWPGRPPAAGQTWHRSRPSRAADFESYHGDENLAADRSEASG